jgi:hypothetical protein
MESGNRGVINAKLAVGIAADAVDAQTQFERPILQTRCLNQQSGHKFQSSQQCKTYIPSGRCRGENELAMDGRTKWE